MLWKEESDLGVDIMMMTILMIEPAMKSTTFDNVLILACIDDVNGINTWGWECCKWHPRQDGITVLNFFPRVKTFERGRRTATLRRWTWTLTTACEKGKGFNLFCDRHVNKWWLCIRTEKTLTCATRLYVLSNFDHSWYIGMKNRAGTFGWTTGLVMLGWTTRLLYLWVCRSCFVWQNVGAASSDKTSRLRCLTKWWGWYVE